LSIEKTLEYIHNVKWQGSKPGLDRTRELVEKLGNPEKKLKFVHIAGTNGKGSTAACVSAVLKRAGYKPGLYTSPYILRFNERMQINGEHISDEQLIKLVDKVRPIADSMIDPPTEFEIITALGFLYFHEQKCDIVVLEVGMGGELDSTNVIDSPEVAVITTIGFDHVKELGPTISDIAAAKAGIIKPGCDVVVYGKNREVELVFENVSKKQGANLIKTDFSRISDLNFALEGIKFNFSPYGKIFLPLLGSYQPNNAAVSITALELLAGKGYNITDEHIVDGLAGAAWPGRFEILGSDPTFILDGAHNPQALEVTAESLKQHFQNQKITFIVGVMADKDVDSMMGYIAPLAEKFIAVRPNHPRAMDAKSLAEKLKAYNAPVTISENMEKAVADTINSARKTDIICAIGSLYFSGDIRNAYWSHTNKK
jgi:dihydrofolate synthase/folylpolyglutamate synthase